MKAWFIVITALIFVIILGGKAMSVSRQTSSWEDVISKTKIDTKSKIDFTDGIVSVFDVAAGQMKDVQREKQELSEWKEKLSSLEFDVNFKAGTERPFTGELNQNKKSGIYRSKISGADLFHSDHKFDSGTGWPSFYKAVHDNNIILKTDNVLFMQRIEILDAVSGAHLGHVFPDGPPPTGLRYCINSASLEFVEGVNFQEPAE